MGTVSRLAAGGPRGWRGGIASSVCCRSPSCPCRWCFLAPGRPLALRCLPCLSSMAHACFPPPAALALSGGAARTRDPVFWPLGHVPQRRLAGRHSVCPPLHALPPGCGHATVHSEEPPQQRRGLWSGERGCTVGRSPVRASAPMRAPTLPHSVHLCCSRPICPMIAGLCSRPALSLVSPSLSATASLRDDG